MKNHHLIICGTSLTLLESSTTCAPSANPTSGTRLVSICNTVSIVSSETANNEGMLSTPIHGMPSSMPEMQNQLIITATLVLMTSPKPPKWSSRGTKKGRAFIPSRKHLRLNSASSGILNLTVSPINGETIDGRGRL